MSTADGPSRTGGKATDICLGLVFASGLAFTAYMLIVSWGGAYWLLDTVAGTTVAVLALARERNRLVTAVAGLAVSAAAIGISDIADLPREPGPATSLALAVLVGSAIRGLSARAAWAVSAGGLVVVTGAWTAGGGAVAVWATLGWLSAVAAGTALRHDDRRRRFVP
ncbi:hypothetical protein ABGB12_32035 [Actinocorallia sp. B10E7]|uniref:hypothetical protein n=1 Tax=Actinocorallia sp. B10E7 TaxID=3153558 RepID=UPI00325CA259